MTTEPLDLTKFLTNYFTANHCEVQNEHNVLTIKLTENMDKAIMNRPFYWQYVQATGQKGEPMTIKLNTTNVLTDHQDENGELIHFGSPRLHTIFNELRQSARFVRLFENINTTTNTMLYPWLVINLTVSFEGKQKKEELFSIGLQLINGTIVLNMMEQLSKISLSRQISNYCYTISPLIKIQSGFKRIHEKVNRLIENRSYKWADESINALHEEIQLINHFYNDEEKHEEKLKEINEAKKRYEPKIVFNPFSGGIFYLSESFLQF